MARTSALLVAVLASLVAVPQGLGQGSGLFATFEFDVLRFRYFPEGLGSGGDIPGSTGLEVFAQNIRAQGRSAQDFRACLDGQPAPRCSYGSQLAYIYTAGNKDGNVSAAEVAAFERVAPAVVGFIQKVRRLQDALQNNITIDGLQGSTPKVVDVEIRDAEGPISAEAPVFVDVTVETHYANDRGAKRHELRANHFQIAKEGFHAFAFRWVVESAKPWVWVPEETRPEMVRQYAHPDAYHSSQEEFEAASLEGVQLVVTRTDNPLADPGNPWLWVGIAGGALLIAGIVYAIMRGKRA